LHSLLPLQRRVGELRGIVILSIMQEAKVSTEHLYDVGTGFLLCDQSTMNGISDREVDVRALILREELLSRPLMKAVDVIPEVVSIDLAGAPSPEVSLEVRELSRELTFVGHAAKLAEPTTLRFRELAVGFHTSVPSRLTLKAEKAEAASLASEPKVCLKPHG
jgi:hypothetical protein